MNAIATKRKVHATTQAAEGLPRLRWTLAEFEQLSELGFFGGTGGERERVELVDGELVSMHAKEGRHEWVRGVLGNHLMRLLPQGLMLYTEPGWRPGGDRYLEPEVIVCPARFRPSEVPPAEVLLLIEVVDSSLAYGSGLKARIYGSLGVREYWVVNARTLVTFVHLGPAAEGYARVVEVTPTHAVTPELVPALAVSLGGLGLD